MLQSLYKFLVLHDHVSIPGVGTFSVARNSAAFKNDFLQPPSTKIRFQAGTAIAEKKFYDFLSAEHHYSAVDAVRNFQDFAYQLKKQIQAYNSVELSGFGILKKNNVGEIVFDAFETIVYYPALRPTEIEAEQVVVPTNNKNVKASTPVNESLVTNPEQTAKDRWWIWACVLALLALTAIGYFYYTQL